MRHYYNFIRIAGDKSMQIAICDDELEVWTLLGRKIKEIEPKAELQFYRSGEELLAAEGAADILFLDIQMPGIGGMRAAEELRKRNRKTIVIFVTALEEYVFQAFDVGAFHYLVKPFDDDKFKIVLTKAVDESYRLNRLEQADQEERYLIIKAGGVHTRIFLKDIVYAEVFNRKLMIHRMEDQLEYYGRMSDLEKQLGEDFFRTHRAYLLHFKYVVSYDSSMVRLEKGSVLMAKQKYAEFVKSYMRYIRRKGSQI